jgi:hypothetical protein
MAIHKAVSLPVVVVAIFGFVLGLAAPALATVR